jgi:transcriptional regulator with XRE-family HTH domain
MNFSQEVKKQMDIKNLTIVKLANQAGISVSYLSDLLRNKKRWNTEIMDKVCNALGISIQVSKKPSISK